MPRMKRGIAVPLLPAAASMLTSDGHLGKRINHAFLPDLIDVERNRPPTSRLCAAKGHERRVVIEIRERRDLSSDELVLRDRIAPTRRVFRRDGDVHERPELIRIFPVFRIPDG